MLCAAQDARRIGAAFISDCRSDAVAADFGAAGHTQVGVKGKDSGSPQVSTKVFEPGNTWGQAFGSAHRSWSITRDTTETFLVLQGKALLTEADGSLRVELRPGVWHTTPSGWTGSWSVEETVRKMFVLSP